MNDWPCSRIQYHTVHEVMTNRPWWSIEYDCNPLWVPHWLTFTPCFLSFHLTLQTRSQEKQCKMANKWFIFPGRIFCFWFMVDSFHISYLTKFEPAALTLLLVEAEREWHGINTLCCWLEERKKIWMHDEQVIFGLWPSICSMLGLAYFQMMHAKDPECCGKRSRWNFHSKVEWGILQLFKNSRLMPLRNWNHKLSHFIDQKIGLLTKLIWVD